MSAAGACVCEDTAWKGGGGPTLAVQLSSSEEASCGANLSSGTCLRCTVPSTVPPRVCDSFSTGTTRFSSSRVMRKGRVWVGEGDEKQRVSAAGACVGEDTAWEGGAGPTLAVQLSSLEEGLQHKKNFHKA